MAKADLVIRVAGEAGEGVLSTGQLLVQGAARAGYRVLTDFSPPAEIKGGYSLFQIRIGSRDFHSRGDAVDLLLAFNREAYDMGIDDLNDGGLLIYDPAEVNPTESANRVQYPVPLSEIARNRLKFELGKNVVAVGVLAALFGMPEEYLRKLIEQRFGSRGPDILNKNLAALEAGLTHVRENITNQPEFRREMFEVERGEAGNRIVVSGNQAASLGALTAGVQFFAVYPITPASDIMEFLAAELPKVGGSVIQAEDEIASMNMVLGAAFAGKRSMTSSSGPGISLMVEALGLGAMAELPCVLVDCQRAGPSTGMPTRHEQGDLWLAAYGGHGEFQRIVLAPTSVEDAYYQIQHAFNLADKYQMPVMLLLDTVLSVRTETIPRPDPQRVERIGRLMYQPKENGAPPPPHEGFYLRYELTDSGISPMSSPGQAGGQYVATGLEHNEEGRPRYDSETKNVFTEKRFKKIEAARGDAPEADLFGDQDAELGIITWGSTTGAVREAIELAAAEGIRVAGMAPKMLWPIPDAQVQSFLEGKQEVIVAEVNFNGQFAQMLQARLGRPLRHLKVYGGEPFKVRDIVDEIRARARTAVR